MLDILNLFKGPSNMVTRDVHAHDDQKAATPEAAAQRAIELAAKVLEQRPGSLELHAKYMQSLLDLLAIQLRRSERAVLRACPDSSACDAVKHTRAKLGQGLQAAMQLVQGKDANNSIMKAEGGAKVTLQALLDTPSILGAMQFCRFFTTHAGLAALHAALGEQQQPRDQQHHCQQQQPTRYSFTLVVDAHGTGHVATLQAALDMAATAAAQGAEQHFGSSCVGSHSACSGGQNLSAKVCTAENKGGEQITSSGPASEHVLLLLLPGTYHASCTVPRAVNHITIAGIPGCTTVLAQIDCELENAKQQPIQPLGRAMAQLQLTQPPAGAVPYSSYAPHRLPEASEQITPNPQMSDAACLLSCPFGVQSVKLQHLQLALAGPKAAGHATPQFLSALPCQDSTPAAPAISNRGRGGSSKQGKGSSSSSSTESSGAAVPGHAGASPYCIRLSAGCQLRLEWCEFSGGAGGVLSEPGALVTAMQCNFHP